MTKNNQNVDQYKPEFERHYQANYTKSGYSYDIFEPAYIYGHGLATDPAHANKHWAEVEEKARIDWELKGEDYWHRFKDVIRYAWGLVRNENKAHKEGR